MDFDYEQYRRANPWLIQNVQNHIAHCGRYPNKEAAIEAARRYEGGVLSVNEVAKIVYVSEIPTL